MKTDSKNEPNNQNEKREAKSDTQKVLSDKQTKNSANSLSEASKKSPRLQDIYRSWHR